MEWIIGYGVVALLLLALVVFFGAVGGDLPELNVPALLLAVAFWPLALLGLGIRTFLDR